MYNHSSKTCTRTRTYILPKSRLVYLTDMELPYKSNNIFSIYKQLQRLSFRESRTILFKRNRAFVCPEYFNMKGIRHAGGKLKFHTNYPFQKYAG